MLQFGRIVFPIEGRFPLCKTDHEVMEADYVDFKSPSINRDFKIEVRKKTFYVDAELFSQCSDFFRVSMNNDRFIEATERRVKICDEKARDVLKLIKAISPYYLGIYPEEVRESTVATLLRLSDKFLVSRLRESCIDFLVGYKPKDSSIDQLLTLVTCLAKDDTIDSTLANIYNKTIFTCLVEVLKSSRQAELDAFIKSEWNKNENMDKMLQAVMRRSLFCHRLKYFEEVQGLSCHTCSKLPGKRRELVVHLCSCCGQEVCRDCRKKPCENLVLDWIKEMRS